MTRLRAGTLTVALLAALLGYSRPVNAATPPPPPPPPTCGPCAGPPPPPARVTPVPTVAATAVSPQLVVAVRLTPSHVRRGHSARVVISATAGSTVTLEVRYRTGKGKTYHARVGDSGTLQTEWKIPASAPIGKADVTVTITLTEHPFSTKLPFAVTR